MNKNEFKLLKIVGCISLLMNNLAYLQQHVLSRVENPPMSTYNFGGIHTYNRAIMEDLDKLIEEVNK